MQTTAATSRWTDAIIDSFINTALDDLRLAGVCEVGRGSFTTTAGDQTEILSATVWKVFSMTYDEQLLTQISWTDMMALTGGDLDAASGVPAFFAVEQNDDGTMIRFDCTFSASGKNVAYWYLKRPQDLVADGDLTGLYRVMVPALVYRTLVLCAKADGNVNEANMWKAEYEEALQNAQLHAKVEAESDAPEVYDPYGWTAR